MSRILIGGVKTMTMMPMYKICPKCRKKYSWNPDVGKFFCPYCHGLGEEKGTLLGRIFGDKKKEK